MKPVKNSLAWQRNGFTLNARSIKLDIVIGGAYLAADIQNLIDDDGEIIDCTTRHYGERRDKKKQGMSMGGM